MFIRFRFYLQEEDYDLSNRGWLQVPVHDFNLFRTSSKALLPAMTYASASGPAKSKGSDIAKDFKKSVKKDKSQYPVFKDEKYWDNWNRSFIITAKSHDLSNILSHTYVPSTDEEKGLFQVQQEFTFSVLNDALQTDYGKTLIRSNIDTCDAQKVYKLLCEHQEKSIKAKLNVSELMRYITSARFDSRWRGTAEGFLLHWKNQLRLLDDLIEDANDRFSPPVRRTLLENAVHDVPDLQAVKERENMDIANGKASLTYEQYFNLLHSAAQQLDQKQRYRKPNYRASLHYQSSQDSDGTDAFTYDTEESGYNSEQVAYNIDLAPSDIYEMHNASGYQRYGRHSGSSGRGETSRTYDRPFIPDDLWAQLSPEARYHFMNSKPPGNAKHHDERQDSLKRSASASPKRDGHLKPAANPRFRANEHEVRIKQEDDEDYHDAVAETCDDENESEERNALLAHVIKQDEQMDPGDIRQVLSSKFSKTKRQKTVNPNQKVLTIDGKRYLEINALVYSVSRKKAERDSSLVDRGANGGLAGSDVRVVSTSSKKKVDAIGIDNHKVDGLDVVTAAGVIKT